MFLADMVGLWISNALYPYTNLISSSLDGQTSLISLAHRKLILEGKCDKAPGQKIKQYIFQLIAECIQLKSVQATKYSL